jgi:GST-like protein
MFESGAILLYLAGKTGRFYPAELRARCETAQWLFWQMGGLGPMAGQAHHFRLYAPEKIPYAINRYTKECGRLYRVLDRRLADRAFLAGEYTIADMACYPWIRPERQGQDMSEFANLARWHEAIKARPAVARAYEIAKGINQAPAITDEQSRRILFEQDQNTVR